MPNRSLVYNNTVVLFNPWPWISEKRSTVCKQQHETCRINDSFLSGRIWEPLGNMRIGNHWSHPLHLWPRTKSQPLILSMTADQEILFCKPCRRLTPEVVVVVVVHVSNIPKHHPTTRGINGLSESCESQFLQKVNGQQPQSGIPWTFKALDIWRWRPTNVNAAYGISSPTIIGYQWISWVCTAWYSNMASGKIPRHPMVLMEVYFAGKIIEPTAEVTSKVTGRKLCDTSHILAKISRDHGKTCYILLHHIWHDVLLHMLRIHPSPVFGVLAGLLLCQSGNGFSWKGSPRNRCKLQPVFFGTGGVNVNLWILKWNLMKLMWMVTCLSDVSFILRFILKPF